MLTTDPARIRHGPDPDPTGHHVRVTASGAGAVSEREAEVLAALGEHQSNAQIARRLHISVRTVESHVSSLLRKLGAADRRELSSLAAAHPPVPAGEIRGVPAGRTTFIGRTGDRESVLAALRGTRLLTLLGPGGMGKTRLAAVVTASLASDYPAGGAFVDLVPARAGFVVAAVADALGVVEQPPLPLEAAVLDRLRGPCLLVLDNCEHLLDEAGAFVERLLTSSPAVTVLATSRERLGVPGELALHVPSLPLATEASALFLDRARAVDPSFSMDPDLVTDLCARLDGMPLAVELAAARAASLGADGLAVALDDRLRLLTGGRGADQRHRSLRAVIGWSHDLLDTEERALFRRLAVFVGGFDLDAAGAMSPGLGPGAVADLMGRLVDKSLVVHDMRGTRSRWRLLDTIRAYGLEQLAASGEQGEIAVLHLRWAAATAADLEDRLDGDWQPGFTDVVDDLRAALLGTPEAIDADAHRLARSLAHLTFARHGFREAQRLYQQAAARAGDLEAVIDLRDAADTAVVVADGTAAYRLLLEAAERAGRAGDDAGRAASLAYAVVAVSRYGTGSTLGMAGEQLDALVREADALSADAGPDVRATVATARAWVAYGARSVPDRGLADAAVDVARRSRDPVLLLGALDALGTITMLGGHPRESHRIASERLSMVSTLPVHQPYAAAEITDAFHAASSAAIATGDLAAARSIAERARTDDPVGDHPYIALPKAIRLLALSGDLDAAITRADALWAAWQRDGAPPMEWMSSAVSLAAMAHGLAGTGDFARWRSRALAVARADDPRDSPDLMACAAFVDARVAVHTGAVGDAPALVDAAFGAFYERWYETYAHAAGAELAVVAGLPDAADRIDQAAAAGAESDWAAACVVRARGRLDGDPALLADAAERWDRCGARFERASTLALLPDRAGDDAG